MKASKNFYFVDFENVHEAGLKGIENLSRDDTIYIFYSTVCCKLPMEILNENSATVKTLSVNTGKQALDIQLSSYLGYCLNAEKTGKNKQSVNFYIVSNDTDFDKIISFWSTQGNTDAITRISTIGAGTTPMTASGNVTGMEAAGNTVSEILAENGVPDEDTDIILTEMQNTFGSSNFKCAFYGALSKRFGQKTGLQYYNMLKACFE